MANNHPSNENDPPLPSSSPFPSSPTNEDTPRRRSSASDKLKEKLTTLTKVSKTLCSKAYCTFQGSLLDAGPPILAALKTAAAATLGGPDKPRAMLFVAVYARPHGRSRDRTLGCGRYLWAFLILPREHREDLSDGHLVHFEERIDKAVFYEVMVPEPGVPLVERERLLGVSHVGDLPEQYAAWNVFDIATRLVDGRTVWECAQEEGRGYEWARLVFEKLDQLDFAYHRMPKGDFWRERMVEADRWLDEQEQADRAAAAAKNEGEEEGGRLRGQETGEESGESVEEEVGKEVDRIEFV